MRQIIQLSDYTECIVMTTWRIARTPRADSDFVEFASFEIFVIQQIIFQYNEYTFLTLHDFSIIKVRLPCAFLDSWSKYFSRGLGG